MEFFYTSVCDERPFTTNEDVGTGCFGCFVVCLLLAYDNTNTHKASFEVLFAPSSVPLVLPPEKLQQSLNTRR